MRTPSSSAWFVPPDPNRNRAAPTAHRPNRNPNPTPPPKQTNRSLKFFTHATPTLFNAGTPRPQLSSCFLLTMKEDSIDGIYDTLKNCACISKFAGGIGVSIHNIRARDSYIRGSNGTSNGIVPMLRVFNDTGASRRMDGWMHSQCSRVALFPSHNPTQPPHTPNKTTARYVDQGGGKRKGSFAIYLEPWHADIFDFLDLRKVRSV